MLTTSQTSASSNWNNTHTLSLSSCLCCCRMSRDPKERTFCCVRECLSLISAQAAGADQVESKSSRLCWHASSWGTKSARLSLFVARHQSSGRQADKDLSALHLAYWLHTCARTQKRANWWVSCACSRLMRKLTLFHSSCNQSAALLEFKIFHC